MNPPTPPAPYTHIEGDDQGDLALVRRMGAGDEVAFGLLYDRWRAVVTGLVTRVLQDAGEVDDVIEEIFWQLWKQSARYDASRGSVRAWLLMVARTRALDRLRTVRRRREESLEEREERGATDWAGVSESSANPALDAEQSEARRLVLAALAELPEEQREVLHLAYYGGLSQTEIAEKTGQPLGTVKTRMRLSMQKLQSKLALLREESR